MKLYVFRTVPLSIIRSFHCKHSDGKCDTGLLTACEQDQDGTQFNPDPARKLSAKLYDINHCCVYSEKLLMMERGTAPKHVKFLSKINLRI
jgi:hypothetical protein